MSILYSIIKKIDNSMGNINTVITKLLKTIIKCN